MPSPCPTCSQLYQVTTKILAYLLLCLSLFIDASHDPTGPQFPSSYNTIIGIWACIISCGATGKDGSSDETALTNVSTFVSVGATSLVFDIVFCSMWGSSLFREYNGRITLILFIVAMVVKAMLLSAYIARIVFLNRSVRSREVREPGSLSENRFVDVEAPFDDGLSSPIKNADETLSPLQQPPPFSPGLPGLISPAPTNRRIETP